jgi:hypothetical protein
MTKKEWLARAYRLDKEINIRIKAQRELFVKATKTTPSYLATGSGGSATQRKSEMYAVYTDEINNMIDRLLSIRLEIQQAIDTIPDSDSILRTILIERYLFCWKWEQIAADIGYSKRETTRKHGEALQKIIIDALN